MKKAIVTFLMMLLPAPLMAQGLEPLPEIELKATRSAPSTDDVAQWLRSLSSVQSGFIQTNPDGTSARGTFSMERPGKVRFEYEDDVPLLIVSDGKTLNMIDYDMGEITRWPVKDTPLAALLDDEFSFSDHAHIESVGPGGLANLFRVIASDPKRPEAGTITMIFEDGGPDGLNLRAWQVLDAQGFLTTVSLTDMKMGLTFSGDHWSFDDPRGNRFKRRRQ